VTSWAFTSLSRDGPASLDSPKGVTNSRGTSASVPTKDAGGFGWPISNRLQQTDRDDLSAVDTFKVLSKGPAKLTGGVFMRWANAVPRVGQGPSYLVSSRWTVGAIA
jgi:hypothetical protein